jgi:flagellar hook assembly protein FlgD
MLNNQFGSLIPCPGPTGSVDPSGFTSAFLSLSGNPITRGAASIRLTLEKGETVKMAIYDLAGRRVRVLADGVLAEGPHTFTWDLSDARGSRVGPSVYWVRATTASGLRAAKAIVVLR